MVGWNYATLYTFKYSHESTRTSPNLLQSATKYSQPLHNHYLVSPIAYNIRLPIHKPPPSNPSHPLATSKHSESTKNNISKLLSNIPTYSPRFSNRPTLRPTTHQPPPIFPNRPNLKQSIPKHLHLTTKNTTNNFKIFLFTHLPTLTIPIFTNHLPTTSNHPLSPTLYL